MKIKLFKNFKTTPINESALKVDDTFKVKTIIDIPVSFLKSYIEKVEKETSKKATDTYTVEELAEQIVKYLVKQNLTVEQVPSSLAVGEKIDVKDDVSVDKDDNIIEIDDEKLDF
jgi:hypothetical protein